MFFMAMVGGAVALGLGICAVDQALDGGIAVLRAAKAEGAREGIKEYRDGPGQEAYKEGYEQGYKACSEDVREMLGG